MNLTEINKYYLLTFYLGCFTLLFGQTVPIDYYGRSPMFNKELALGSGGRYMSNEIAYRVARLRELFNKSIKTGHLHVPSPDVPIEDAPVLVDNIKEILKNMLHYVP